MPRQTIDVESPHVGGCTSKTVSKRFGCDRFCQVEVFDGGDCFALRRRSEPAVFKGTAATFGTGSIISGSIVIPAQGTCRFSLGSVLMVSIRLVGASAHDLLFGSHPFLTRSRTEIGPGHAADAAQHGSVFVLVPRWQFRLLFCFGQRQGVSRANFVRRSPLSRGLVQGDRTRGGSKQRSRFLSVIWGVMIGRLRLRSRALDPPGVSF